jgi:3-phenylpropionate/cinnamic acid dioxygenase small subunit
MDEPTGRLADDVAIQRLMTQYSRCVDDARFEDAAALFTADGAFDYSESRRVGRDAIMSFLKEFQVPERRGRHMCATPIVDYHGDDDATSVTDFVFFGKAGTGWFVKFVGRYHDALRRNAHGWRLAERRVALVDPTV